ncbi:MAG: hypothetical protein AABZ30_04015 [Myxococcota bacterium]
MHFAGQAVFAAALENFRPAMQLGEPRADFIKEAQTQWARFAGVLNKRSRDGPQIPPLVV